MWPVVAVLLLAGTSEVARSQNSITHQQLMQRSFVLARHMGTTFQMQLNCKLKPRMGPVQAAGFFINYMNQSQVQSVIDEYVVAMKRVIGQPCDRSTLGRLLPETLSAMVNYVDVAKPFMRPR